MARVFLIHGAFKFSGPDWGKLPNQLEARGHDVVVVDYGWAGALTARFRSKRAAANLSSMLCRGDSVVAFSNGALVAYHLARQVRGLETVVLVQPALYRDAKIPAAAVFCLYNSQDWVVQAARWWSALTPMFWERHGWGAMGRVGPTDPDIFPVDTKALGASGHWQWRDRATEFIADLL